MRHRNLWATGLALGLGLGMVGMTLGQDPSGGGNWFTRLFARGGSPAAHKDDKGPILPVVSPTAVRKQAEDDFLRRLSVCDRLRETAIENGDNELLNKADLLQMRAKDAYIQRINRVGGVVASIDEETLENHLAPTSSLTPLSSGTKTKSGNSRASLEERE